MSEVDRDMWRKAATECVELAEATSDPTKKEVLLGRAQEWLKLAYSKGDAEFGRHLEQLNSSQMESRGPASTQRVSMQRQPVQQQQSKLEPEDEK